MKRARSWQRFLPVLSLVASTPLAGQLVPFGSDFLVNELTTGDQSRPRVAPLEGGGWVVVWSGEGGAGDGAGIFGRAFTADGTPGPQFRVNTVTAGVQDEPAVGGGHSTGFVVVWNLSDTQLEIAGQRFNNAGVPLGTQFQVNTVTSSNQVRASVAVAPPGFGDGTFVVTWGSIAGEDGSVQSIIGQRFAAAGNPVLAPFVINSYTTGAQLNPRVAMNPDSEFVTAWDGDGSGDGDGVFARAFSMAAPLSTQVRANAVTTGFQGNHSVTWDSADSFVVVWISPDPGGGIQNDIYARRFSQAGSAQTGELRVNSITTNLQNRPDVAAVRPGDFVVVWHSFHFQAGNYDILAQRVVGSSLAGEPMRINSITTGAQGFPSITRLDGGRYVVVWQGVDADGDGIFGRRLCFLRGDANGNGVVAVDDILYLINGLFAGGPAPVGIGDADGDTLTTVSDILYLINFLFAGGPQPHCV